MAIVLQIDNGDNMGRVDYTRYLASPERTPAVLRDRMNLPALFDFTVVPADERFLQPRRGAYVRLTGLAGALPPGGPRIPGPLFTGYITNEPAVEFLGTRGRWPVHGYRCEATGEEYLLNIKRIGLLPPFLNQTAGGILRFLTDHLQPGRFDLSAVQDGALIPHFVVQPDRSWSEVAQELADRAGFYCRVLDGKIYFEPVGGQPAGITVDERDRHFRPEALEIAPLGNPIHNDVTVLGGTEPQAYVHEHFVGDGFTSRFPLIAPVFGVESAQLLVDDFTGAAIDTATWQETDPASSITLFGGRLNVTGGTGNLGETFLLARQALELGGELEIIHGEFEFVSSSTGILGGLYSDSALGLADCLLGFEASPIGGSTRLRAITEGVVQATDVMVQPNHHYVLVTRLSGDQPFRTLQTFLSLGATFGGFSVSSTIRVTFEVRAIDLSDPGKPVVTILHETTLTTLPPFAFYAPINSADLHVVANFLQVTRPMQARLTTQRPGHPVLARALGFGIAAHDATITSDPHSNQWALEFYEDTIPIRGEKIVLSYRAAGQTRARVTDSTSIAAEAALAGDDGVRAVVLREVNPPPRTSAEAEQAGQAYLADHTIPRYEGRYSTWSRFAQNFPRSGALLEIRNESRYPVFSAPVRGVTSEFRELAGEEVFHTAEFGEPSRFEQLLRHFSPVENVLEPTEDWRLDPADTADIGTRFIADAPGLALTAVTPTQFVVDMGAAPQPGGSFTVRRSDQGWGSNNVPGTAQNLVGSFAAQSFSLSRSARNQVYYIRPVAATGETSRFSSVLAMHYPLPPASPQAVQVLFGASEQGNPVISISIELFAAAIADVDLVELRDDDNTTILARWEFGQMLLEGGVYRIELALDNSSILARSKTVFAYTVNTLGEYSPPFTGIGSQAQPLKPSPAAGNSSGQILEILLDTYAGPIVETQVQVASPGGDFSAPAQDILLPGQPEKFSFIATQSGGWGFRARRRDPLGWSPWSSEPQGQLPAQSLVFNVEFFRADELDPSVGAAVNAQNLLPNAEFFLGGIAGQEGIHAARYFTLRNAAADGSEVDHSVATNEMRWKSGANFTAANPGFRSLLSNLGRLFNPGESVTLSAALRHTGPGLFSNAIRIALRSVSVPAYDQSKDVAATELANDYRWLSVTFTLPANQAVPDDLSAEITVVLAAGQSVNADLYCDKTILNRGHRPAAFGLAPWDVIALAWNASVGAYDLPATIAGGTPRTTDPGNAGLLTGTGTEDLDPDFTGRYFRTTA